MEFPRNDQRGCNLPYLKVQGVPQNKVGLAFLIL